MPLTLPVDYRSDTPHRRLQPSILLARAAIPHVIWGQDAEHYSLVRSFFFWNKLDLQILLPPSRIQEAVALLSPLYSPMTCDETDKEERAYNASHRDEYSDYTLAFRDRLDDFVRLKSLERNTWSDPSRVLLISNTIFNYPLDETTPISLPLCPILPFPTVSALLRLMPIHLQKCRDTGYTHQIFEFVNVCRALLGRAIGFSFPEEVQKVYSNADELPTRLKEMISSLDEREKRWVYDCFAMRSNGSSDEAVGSDDDDDE
ncbi:hypothetical protein EDD18DRAFT_1157666 [Armillaria luteobubalina]|uniref:Uncharacterized protein n=1 Tax=Armillaria luteobubalina TaxID=153913 RepID=A0AA39UYL8_9AGAR|nr:hypothetical protein EDD18DRAFT_1157666 [Armillaria luteobubalina]